MFIIFTNTGWLLTKLEDHYFHQWKTVDSMILQFQKRRIMFTNEKTKWTLQFQHVIFARNMEEFAIKWAFD